MEIREIKRQNEYLYRLLDKVDKELFVLTKVMSPRVFGFDRILHLYEHEVHPFVVEFKDKRELETLKNNANNSSNIDDSDGDRKGKLVSVWKKANNVFIDVPPPGVVVMLRDLDFNHKQTFGSPCDFTEDIIQELRRSE